MYKVYFVDDERYILDEMKIIVDWKREGFSVAGCCTDPVEAEREICRIAPDVVFLDIYMRRLNGLELARRLRERFPEMVIAFLSAYDKFDYAVQAIDVESKAYFTKPIQEKALLEFLEKCRKILGKKERKGELLGGLNYDGRSEAINEILETVKRNPAEKISFVEIANRFHYTVSHFSKYFKSQTGLSFTEFIVKYRLERATELIRTTDKPLREIACEVGYEDYYQFSKIFRKHLNVSPTEYKKNCRKK
ncbi:MAG: helix-turn-helix domain-containing protein [Clostridia bacterium]|nr:helix-turn-helix domain-containing protein [Clostridia bacterium]